MSQTKYPLSDDIKKMCIAIVRGHDTRKANLQDRLEQAEHSSAQPFDEYTVNGEQRRTYHQGHSNVSDPTASRAAQIIAVHDSTNARFVHAVEQARFLVGRDMVYEEQEKLRKAIWDSCILGRGGFVYSHYDLPMSKDAFYNRHRNEFLWNIAVILGLMEV